MRRSLGQSLVKMFLGAVLQPFTLAKVRTALMFVSVSLRTTPFRNTNYRTRSVMMLLNWRPTTSSQLKGLHCGRGTSRLLSRAHLCFVITAAVFTARTDEGYFATLLIHNVLACERKRSTEFFLRGRCARDLLAETKIVRDSLIQQQIETTCLNMLASLSLVILLLLVLKSDYLLDAVKRRQEGSASIQLTAR